VGNDRYFSDLAETPSGAALLIFKEALPEELQPLETVRSEVESDWKAEEKRRLFSEQAAEWENAFAAVSEGSADFKDVAKELGFTVEEPETFKAAERPAELRGTLWNVVQLMDEGELSDVVLTDSAANICLVVEKNSPPEMASAAQVLFQNELADRREANGGWYILREWASKTLAQIEPKEQP
jgi:peptidyl-prolyl cis-trans isomerase D